MDQSHPNCGWRPSETRGGDDGLLPGPHGHGGLPDQNQTQSGTNHFHSAMCLFSAVTVFIYLFIPHHPEYILVFRRDYKFSSFTYLHLHKPSPPFFAWPQLLSTFSTSAVGGLAPDSMSARFHNPHMCHDIKVQGHWIGCPPHNHFQHSP